MLQLAKEPEARKNMLSKDTVEIQRNSQEEEKSDLGDLSGNPVWGEDVRLLKAIVD